jgi:hypothetical protein
MLVKVNTLDQDQNPAYINPEHVTYIHSTPNGSNLVLVDGSLIKSSDGALRLKNRIEKNDASTQA